MDLVTCSMSALIFFPLAAAALISLIPGDQKNVIRFTTLLATLVMFGVVLLGMALPTNETISFDIETAGMQNVVSLPWIPSFNIDYFLGFDGISFPLVVLTALISALAMGASWTIEKHVKGYCVLYLILLTGMMGVFVSLDFFLFYIFWEVMLLPMYFLIGVWGGPRKEYAAIKFFLYTLFGSVLMLVAILMIYFNSDLRQLSPQQLVDSNVRQAGVEHLGAPDQHLAAATKYHESISAAETPVHTFNLLALQQLGQHSEVFDKELLFGKSLQWWAFVLLFIGFAIKVPSVPFHTWLPDAHVEAPTPISMILAGVLLKMGGYGIIRICYPICPDAGYDLAWVVCSIGVISMIYGAFAALAQTDFKRMVAYSSVSHMGYVVLGLGVWSATVVGDPVAWNMGVKGAMFQMIGHGVSSAGMFFMVGVIYDRVHHRNLNEFGGLFGKMPVYTSMAIIVFFAGLGLPGLCGFIGEAFVVLSVWKFSAGLAVAGAFVVILTAGYILWAVQRVYLGAEYKGPHAEALTEINIREMTIAVPLCVLAILFGVLPHTVFRYMDATIDQQVQDLATWTKETKIPRLQAEKTEQAATAAVAPGLQQHAADAAAVHVDAVPAVAVVDGEI
ncbi:NADH-quinone oxidoreductase subunit M [Blastopirellula sp. J2-11]|uniref:complex I subunit 4 family protein n=1 Tax=Blastopirellula sp. J2-11 TaxID=2943192 RepID=UPI0021C8EBDE|nr:NADH-quinone oxidoreductase subunit M [Blastopirellula sp. J2-11]UUO05846.1 NADH-quinone oxidoreductase subunit M [Blastopirellula sp. J2-11]